MSKQAYRPRILVEITLEQRQILNRYLEYGMQKRVFDVIVEDVVAMLNEFGNSFVLYMTERRFSYRDQMVEYENTRSEDTRTK